MSQGRDVVSTRRRRMSIFALAVAALCLALSAPSAWAVDSHVLNPTLSLAGGPGTISTDTVPDPGASHPEKVFNDPCGVATDAYGDIYVANGAGSTVHEVEGESRFDGRIDVFAPTGEFITEIRNEHWPCSLAVDSSGHVFVEQFWLKDVVRYDPIAYEPESGNIEYNPTATTLEDSSGSVGLTVDPSSDDLYLARGGGLASWVEDWTAEHGGGGSSRFGEGEAPEATSIDVWGQNGDVFASGSAPGEPGVARAYLIDGTSHKVESPPLDGSNTPDGGFGFSSGRAGVAIDQANGDLYLADVVTHHAVDQFTHAGGYIGQIKLGTNGLKNSEPFSDVAVDQGEHSPNQGYVYVTSGFQTSNSHLYAFAPVELNSPDIRGEQAEEVGRGEALLTAELNPHGAATAYHFEYGTADCATSTCQSTPVPDADGGSGAAFNPVSAPVASLSPGTTYHFRLVASSHCNPAEPAEECVADGPDATFTTFPAAPPQNCANAALRTGASASLPDCRAYELVSPADTNGRVPGATMFGEGVASPPELLAAADGESLLFGTEGGALPGLGGGGFHDAYVSRRGPSGWTTEFTGLSGAQAQEPYATGTAPDHGYSFWAVGGTKGSLANEVGTIGGATMNYLRGPSGTIEPIGVGSGGTDPRAKGLWISPGAEHVIFSSAARLEPNAPEEGTLAIYDRRPGGATTVVSLLPGGATPAAGEDAAYQGASADGSAVAFKLGGAMYVYPAGGETRQASAAASTFGGLSADGRFLVYVSGGDLFRFDVATGTTEAIGSGGESTLVNVSADGSHVYFVSPLVLSGGENSEKAKALAGGENLYAWDASSKTVSFVATVEEEDVVGEAPPVGGQGDPIGGLGLWTSDAVAPQQGQFVGPANDPSRTDPSGAVFVFESRAQLSGYDNGGHTEIYRYDAVGAALTCLSCSLTKAPATSEARLESRYAPRLHAVPPLNAVSLIDNVVAGGNRVFFETGDALSPEDTDGTNDVYEWEASGTGGCLEASGCVELISSGRSAGPNFLYGVGGGGRDVFFWSGDRLVTQDTSDAPSIYDARELGGFAPVAAGPACQDEGCQGPLATPPSPLTPSTSAPAKAKKPPHTRRHGKKHHRRHHKSRHGRPHRKGGAAR